MPPCRIRRADLAECLVEDNPRCSRQVQTAGFGGHRNGTAPVGILLQQGFRQPAGLASKDQIIAVGIAFVPVRPLGFCGEKKVSGARIIGLQIFERSPLPDVATCPVIHSRATERLFLQGKSERANQVETGAGGEAKSRDISRIRRNFRLDENNVQHAMQA